MKLVPLFSILAVFSASAAMAAPPVRHTPVPPPSQNGFQQEQLISVDGARIRIAPNGIVDVRRELNLQDGTQLNSIILIASDPVSYASVEVLIDRQSLFFGRLSPMLSTLQIPVNVQLQRGHRIVIRINGQINFGLLGATILTPSNSLPPTYPPTYPPTPPQQPPMPPQPPTFGPSCDLLGAGSYRGFNWNYRIAINGSVVEASDSLSDILQKMSQMENARMCTRVPTNCKLQGTGSYRGFNWNYLLSTPNGVIYSSDTRSDILGTLKNLGEQNVCRVMPEAPCTVLGAGSYRGFNWNYRIGIGNEIVDATDVLTEATNTVTQFRNAGVCF